MDAPPIELYNRLRGDLTTFVNEVVEYTDKKSIEVPKTAVYSTPRPPNTDPETIISKPSKIFSRRNPPKKWFFKDTASWLVENGYGFDIPPGLSPDNSDGIRQYYRKRLFEFSKLFLDYMGDIKFDEEVFEAAYDDYFTPRYTSTHTHNIIVPLPRLSLSDRENRGSLSLRLSPPELSFDDGPCDPELIDDLVISELTDSEWAGLRTYGVSDISSSSSKQADRFKWNYKLTIPIEVRHLPSFHEDSRTGIDPSWTATRARRVGDRVANQVKTSLRLYSPREYVGIGPTFCPEKSWKSYRGLCQDFHSSLNGAHARDSPTVTLEWFTLKKSDYEDYREHWEKYRSICDPESDSLLVEPISRFNKMFYGQEYTDHIIDGYLGFELTLASTRLMTTSQKTLR